MKKKLIIALLAVCTMNATYAQLRKIPAEVTNSFTQKFPDATNIEWRDQLVDFKAAFEENGTRYEAKFSNQGDWLMTEQYISKQELPNDVALGFSKSEFTKWEIRYAAIIETPDNDTQYRVMVAKNNLNKKDLLFNSDGQLVKDNFTF